MVADFRFVFISVIYSLPTSAAQRRESMDYIYLYLIRSLGDLINLERKTSGYICVVYVDESERRRCDASRTYRFHFNRFKKLIRIATCRY